MTLSPVHGPVRRVATRVELSVRVYSAGRLCQDCGARRSNDARGQPATVVYAELHTAPVEGRSHRPRRPRPPPNTTTTHNPANTKIPHLQL
ncbi:jg19199 [Pararge aegeria aegeria]|uniref:Jg19199 protein n=1 Tax=Pararge aegeria aegeria TaxID=348720 RepID=A0A8S4SPD3_9NEOP|nr:jg19199 [Pararge aegeria aegeria]